MSEIKSNKITASMKYWHIFLSFFFSYLKHSFTICLENLTSYIFDSYVFQTKFSMVIKLYTFVLIQSLHKFALILQFVQILWMKIFYLPNVFVKNVKVNKTNQNMFESSHKTSLVSKICTTVKSCILIWRMLWVSYGFS